MHPYIDPIIYLLVHYNLSVYLSIDFRNNKETFLEIGKLERIEDFSPTWFEVSFLWTVSFFFRIYENIHVKQFHK